MKSESPDSASTAQPIGTAAPVAVIASAITPLVPMTTAMAAPCRAPSRNPSITLRPKSASSAPSVGTACG